MFCEFKTLVVKVSGKKVNALWSYNYGEYFSNEFKNFSAVEGIKQGGGEEEYQHSRGNKDDGA